LAHEIAVCNKRYGAWPILEYVCRLTLDKAIPRPLRLLQPKGRRIKSCLVQGDLWDENTATGMNTGELVFDAGSIYSAHNEYEISIWRALRHRLSSRSHLINYMRKFSVSEPLKCSKVAYTCLSAIFKDSHCLTGDKWDTRNPLHSLRFDIGTAILIPGYN